ncbi:winged helix-turn-helix domain-containing protein [Haloarcula salina]|uniref:Helix-turn-helix domain-containing protein n=1 Tax=Haloarcula salina TaxID=1429914 RepID=A0AA41KER8_9EURY|nr:helix-turn-helix domain-containing protein [Haloarcula salina]MBV0901227.1 helix-turn-helix domain-containing protein [Haloarcula salina]
MSAFESDVELADIVVRDTDVSSAVDEPVRAMILDMLAEEAMTVEAVHEELGGRGFERTVNTIRHHINELRNAGLVEVERMEERRGGTLKFYRANTIVLSYSVPDGSREKVAEMADWMSPRLEPLIGELRERYEADLTRIADQMAPCEHCTTQKFETYLLLTVLRRGFVDAYGGPERGDQ